MATCGPAAPQDHQCQELQDITGLAGREQDSLRDTRAAPALDIRHVPADGTGQGLARTLVCGSTWLGVVHGWAGQSCWDLEPGPDAVLLGLTQGPRLWAALGEPWKTGKGRQGWWYTQGHGRWKGLLWKFWRTFTVREALTLKTNFLATAQMIGKHLSAAAKLFQGHDTW